MGNIGMTREHASLERYTFPQKWQENYPSHKTESPYDPLEGFPNGRKPRGKIQFVFFVWNRSLKSELSVL